MVYSTFSEADRTKFRKILCHKRYSCIIDLPPCLDLVNIHGLRDALNRAFDILGYDPELQNYVIQFHDFIQFMACYKPRIRE